MGTRSHLGIGVRAWWSLQGDKAIQSDVTSSLLYLIGTGTDRVQCLVYRLTSICGIFSSDLTLRAVSTRRGDQ